MSVSASELSANGLSSTIIPNQVPKTGTVIPNRIFVGGIATQTTDLQLKEFFSAYGAVKDTKIICDRAGISKGYGFVTFETQEDAEKIINKESENLVFKDRKLNIGPAVRKQQAYPRLIDGYPAVSGAATMLFAPNPYGYAAAGGLTMMPSESYQQALQQQVQAPVTPSYPNMIIPAAQIPMYMNPQSYQYSASPMQAPVAAQTIQYANGNQQWIPAPARCYQPTAVTAVSTSNMYPESMAIYAAPATNASGVTPQFLEVPEGTMHENNDAESRGNSVVSSSDVLHSQLTNQAITSLMSLHAAGRAMHHPFHGNNSVSPQPPPIKKMTPLPSHYQASDSIRCFSAPAMVGASMKPTVIPGSVPRVTGLTYLPSHHDMRVKYEHDGRLAASIAPPTPPATPASGGGGN